MYAVLARPKIPFFRFAEVKKVADERVDFLTDRRFFGGGFGPDLPASESDFGHLSLVYPTG